jgi:hypothetical protein
MEYSSEEEDNIDYFEEVNDLCNNLQIGNRNYNYTGLNYLNTNIHDKFKRIQLIKDYFNMNRL